MTSAQSCLNSADRARLRATINIEALERFLAATPPSSHRFYLLACFSTLSDAEVRELGLLVEIPPALRGTVDPAAYWAPARNHRLVGQLLGPALEARWREVELDTIRGA